MLNERVLKNLLFKKVPGSIPLYIPEEQLLFLLSGHDHMLRHQVVLSDVDQQLRLQELEINTETISQSNQRNNLSIKPTEQSVNHTNWTIIQPNQLNNQAKPIKPFS